MHAKMNRCRNLWVPNGIPSRMIETRAPSAARTIPIAVENHGTAVPSQGVTTTANEVSLSRTPGRKRVRTLAFAAPVDPMQRVETEIWKEHLG